MRYIKSYKIYESEIISNLTYDELMGKLLHLYGSIPVPKEKSSIVIQKIIQSTREDFYQFGEVVDINYCKVHDKIRFSDYFHSLLRQKDIRGHNFEGLICGIFGGFLSTRGTKWDVTTNDKNYSVKFVDNKTKAPEIGKFKNIIESSSYDIDGWILSYPDDIENPSEIIVNVVPKALMWTILSNGLVVAPKGGYNDYYSLALSAKYRNIDGIVTSKIKIPRVSKEELVNEWRNLEEENWATKVFGEWGYKIRPDVLRYIKTNKTEIIKKLSEL